MKPDDSPPEEFLDLVRSVRDLEQRAAQQYRPVVEHILRTGDRDVQHIERTLDGLLDFCSDDTVLDMYKQLCRYYLAIDPAAVADYVRAYRECWDSDEQGDLT